MEKISIELLKQKGFEVKSYIATGDFYLQGKIKFKISERYYNFIVSAIDYQNWNILVESNLQNTKTQTQQKNILPIKNFKEVEDWYKIITQTELN